MINHILTNKGLNLNINKQQINITLSKSELTAIINEALLDESASASIKRVLNPFIANSFPQFPAFTAVTLGTTDESGTTNVVLKVPVIRTKSESTDDQSPSDLDIPTEEAESGPDVVVV